MTAINKNNTIGKVLSIIGDKMDGDSVMLVDSHFNNALKSVCKWVAENKPLGHEKLLVRQVIPEAAISNSIDNENQWYEFSLPDGSEDSPYPSPLYPVVNTGTFTKFVLRDRSIYDIDAGNSRVTGRWTYRGYGDDIAGPELAFHTRIWNPEGVDDNAVTQAIVDSNADGLGVWYVMDSNDPPDGYYVADGNAEFPDLITSWFQVGDTGDDELPVFTIVGEKRGRQVHAIRPLSLVDSHGVVYYMIEGNKVIFNAPTDMAEMMAGVAITHYIYATADQFPVELEDLLIAELLRLISNEATKQHNEKLENI
jgi:hypothetical protein